VAAVVSGKAGNAVWRNRIKRIIKDTFRINKEILLDVCRKKNIFVQLVLSPYSLNQKNCAAAKRVDLETGLIDILNKIKKNL
jgi:ribonuclease P protein component